MKNDYAPAPAEVVAVRDECFETRTFRVRFTDRKRRAAFRYVQGQFMELSLPGAGEAPISITSSPSRPGYLEFTIRRAGRVTSRLFDLKRGGRLFLRGPYGNSFPFTEARGRNLVFIAGGIGLPPLRSVINLVADRRAQFGKVTILYGARTPADLCFTDELRTWAALPDTEVLITVDAPTADWRGHTGVVTTLWDRTTISPRRALAYVCGPPVMIKFAAAKLVESSFPTDRIFVTMERHMKCGIGKCGHCNLGEKFVCVDGPVFTYRELLAFPPREKAL